MEPSIVPLTSGPLAEMKRILAMLEVHGIDAELLRPRDLNKGS